MSSIRKVWYLQNALKLYDSVPYHYLIFNYFLLNTDEDAPAGEFVQIGGKKVKGVGLGNIFAAGPIKLRGKEVSTSRESNGSPLPEDGKDSNRVSTRFRII